MGRGTRHSVTRLLPALRADLDLMPSPVPDQPGLLIRDPMRFAEAILIVPPPLASCLSFFDGRTEETDAKAALVRATGDVRAGTVIEHLVEALGGAGFLRDEAYEQLRTRKEADFAAAERRDPAHAGSAYPEEAAALALTLEGYFDEAESEPPSADGLVGLAAPHVSPEGGWRSYAAAYAALWPEGWRAGFSDRTFVILGTSHYGEAERFGLTAKPFRTPFGDAATDADLVAELRERGGPAVRMEDYCHAVEHAIEFQVVFLQHLLGPRVRIVPILCGPYARATLGGGWPEDDPGVATFLEALRQVAGRERDRLFFVLGVDLAHVGRRYGDPEGARAHERGMIRVADRDRERLQRVQVGDAAGFWRLVQDGADDLKWCGASPLYTFLRTVDGVRGELLEYEQWNIDDESVVTFAGLAFREEERQSR
jgi:AmmeMemoRadiSam system protein B